MLFFHKVLQIGILHFWLFLQRIEWVETKTAPFARKRPFTYIYTCYIKERAPVYAWAR